MRPSAFLFSALLGLGAAGAPPKPQIAPEEAESVVEAVFETPSAKEWERSVPESEASAAKFQLQDWVYQHPEQSIRVHAGLVLDEQKFRRLLGEYFSYFSDPQKSFNQLDRVATLSDEIMKKRGLTDEGAKELTRRVFEGLTAGGGTPLADALKPVDWTRLPSTGLKLDPKAFEQVRADGGRRLPAERDALSVDRREAQSLGLTAALDSSFLEREENLRRADVASRDFGSVLAKRPQAAESLTSDELRLLSHSRNELYRWLAAAALARGEHRFRRLRVQLDEPRAAERMVADLSLGDGARRGFSERLQALKDRLDAYLQSAARLRRMLAEGDDVDLREAARLAERNEREAAALQAQIRGLLEAPRLLRRAERGAAELPWWKRLLRWFFTAFLPESERGRRYRGELAARRILRERLERAADPPRSERGS